MPQKFSRKSKEGDKKRMTATALTKQPESPPVPVEVFREMERRDESQILAEMRGELLEEFVYAIDIQGKHVTNLSYVGVKEAIRQRGNVEILNFNVTEDEKEYHAIVRVRDHHNKIDVLGASSCEKNKPFSYTLAVNKAERNAFAKLIPAKFIATLIADYVERTKPVPVEARIVTPSVRQPNSTAGIQIPALPPSSPPLSPAKVPESLKDIASHPELPKTVWHVPRISNQLLPDHIKAGARQYPLFKGLQSFGMVNVVGDEIAIVPERAVEEKSALIDGFLFRKVIEPLASKHKLTVEREKNSQGKLTAILLRGKLEEEQIRELVSGSRWAFERALQEKKPAEA
jgi:hypothetical protein